jgi:hypothetical protein
MARTHDIYLSSTLNDLKAERAAVQKLLHERGYGVKQSYTADERALVESCLADVASAAIYVAIVGLRYGFLPPGGELSTTELEYREARRLGKPCFVFLKDEGAQTFGKNDIDAATGENGAGARIAAFRASFPEDVRAASFKTVDELRDALFAVLPRFEQLLAGPPPRKRPARAAKARPSELATRVQGFARLSPAKAIADLLHGRIGAEQLDAIAADDALARSACRGLLAAHRAEASPWLRGLLGEVLARRADAGSGLIVELAFDDGSPWTDRLALLSGLRYADGLARAHARRALQRKASGADIDDMRLAIRGFGYLGEEASARGIADREGYGRHGVLDGGDSFIVDKLGSHLVQAGLDSAIHRESALNGGLALMTYAVGVLGPGRATVSAGAFKETLHQVRPGLAQPLLRHALALGLPSYAQGLLFALIGRLPAPAAVDALALAKSDPAHEARGYAAIASAGHGSVGALFADLAGSAAAVPDWAPVLAAGWARDAAQRDAIERTLDDPPSYAQACALWAAGRLSRDEPVAFVARLRKATLAPEPWLRGPAWLGLAHTGEPPAEAELKQALDHASAPDEQVMLGIAGACAGHVRIAEAGLVAADRHGEPIWRLWHRWRHLYTDFETACATRLGAPGMLVEQILKRGHL